MTVLARLAEEVGVDERTLRRAIEQGTLRATRPSARKLDISVGERRYLRRSWPLLAALRSALRTESNVRLAVLFGSAAAGTDTPASDVDLLVALRDASLDRVIDLGVKLGHILGREVDVVRLDDAKAEPPLMAEITDTGRVIVDRDAQWPKELRRRRAAASHDADRTAAALAGIDRFLARGRDA